MKIFIYEFIINYQDLNSYLNNLYRFIRTIRNIKIKY